MCMRRGLVYLLPYLKFYPCHLQLVGTPKLIIRFDNGFKTRDISPNSKLAA